jgi:hypothetical protein
LNATAISGEKDATDARKNSEKKLKFRESVAKKFKSLPILR